MTSACLSLFIKYSVLFYWLAIIVDFLASVLPLKPSELSPRFLHVCLFSFLFCDRYLTCPLFVDFGPAVRTLLYDSLQFQFFSLYSTGLFTHSSCWCKYSVPWNLWQICDVAVSKYWLRAWNLNCFNRRHIGVTNAIKSSNNHSESGIGSKE